MKSLSVIALTVAFLSAGAFAKHPVAPPARPGNVTVVEKNQAWPIKAGYGFADCDSGVCVDI